MVPRIFTSYAQHAPVSKIRDDDLTVAYVMRPVVVAPEAADRLPGEPADSTAARDFKDAGGIERTVFVVEHVRPDPRPFHGGGLTKFGVPCVLTCARRTSGPA